MTEEKLKLSDKKESLLINESDSAMVRDSLNKMIDSLARLYGLKVHMDYKIKIYTEDNKEIADMMVGYLISHTYAPCNES